jgi:hypothetical protein
MATVTPNVRYISLFTAIRYLRQLVGEAARDELSLPGLWRRVEALIAVSSVLHHQDGDQPPMGIIGRGYADAAATRETIKLETRLRNPPYNIYRGTLASLGLFDLATSSDPLFESAQELACSWDPSHAGEVGGLLQQGILPPELPRNLVAAASGAFCLCRVPDGSHEQRALIGLLFGLGARLSRPCFEEEEPNLQGVRAASWRLLLELLAVSEGRRLAGEHLMGRLLEPDLLRLPLMRPLADCLLVWRWVAARSFLERGWTIIFNRTLDLVRAQREGLPSSMLREAAKTAYLGHYRDEPLSTLVREAKQLLGVSSTRLIELFRRGEPRDCLQLAVIGVLAAKRDYEQTGLALLTTLSASRAISSASQELSLGRALAEGMSTSDFYAALSEETLVQHVHTALRKMSQGNPDSLHVDFDSNRWIVPSKALDWHPRAAEAVSRLDIALGWALQLSLTARDGDHYSLTPLGLEVRTRWDQEYAAWG